jgi:catechol-2,3-dioxygenase
MSGFAVSHLEFRVRDVAAMEAFYTGALGFTVTDRGEGPDGMVFLSRSADEHHQLVLNPVGDKAGTPDRLDHVAFRVNSLDQLRRFHSALKEASAARLETVSHGNTWSVYFLDPEGNRLELFVDTPWHVDQPARFAIDLSLTDDELAAATEAEIRKRKGFRGMDAWRNEHRERIDAPG